MGTQRENRLRSFEREVLQKMFGSTLENGCWGGAKPQKYALHDEYDLLNLEDLDGLDM